MNKNIIEFLKENHQSKAIELEDKFSSVNIILRDVMGDLISKAQVLQEKKDYNEVMNVVEIQKNINEAMNSNQKLISQLRIENLKEADKESRLTLDDDYLLDSKVPYNLKEDFRFKRPYAFSMGEHYAKVSTWKELLVATCNYLNKLNPEMFHSFASDQSMQWGKTYNFSENKDLLRGPALIEGSNVYVETNKDSIAVRQLIIKMLERYNLDVLEFKVYLRADYTDRRKSNNN